MTTTETTTGTYRTASEKAQRKGPHNAAAGSLELGPDYTYYGRERGECQGRVRTTYVRLTVPDPAKAKGRRNPGKPKWEAVGVLCVTCGAYWARPELLEALTILERGTAQ